MSVYIPRSLQELPTSEVRYVGQPVERVEDPSLLTGRTEFIDNFTLPGMLHCAILRSPHAHARVRSVDATAAETALGVHAVVTAEDFRRWCRPISTVPEKWGSYSLATDKVRFVGEPVAAVAASNRYLAEDALELISVDYEPLPPVLDPHKAIEADSPLVFEERETNVMFHRVFNWGDTDAVFAAADHVFSESFRWHRLGANPLETFGVVAQWDQVENDLTVHGAFQAASMMAMGLAARMRLPPNKVRVIPHPHGGSFGGKGGGRGSDIACLLSRKAAGRPVKWIEDRMEYLIGGGGQAWDRRYEASLAVTADGLVMGLRIKLLDDIGAGGEGYAAISAAKPLSAFTGCYAIDAAQYDLTIVATNKLPSSAYRGMGPPPHNYVLEQMMDIAARGLGMDPAEFRRRNYIPSGAFPYTIPSGNEYDSGNYEATLNAALELGSYESLRAEQAAARAEGRLYGIGIVNSIEPGVFNNNIYNVLGRMGGTAVPEGVTLSLDLSGKTTARVGFALEGQGQYTFVAQLLADYFGLTPADVRVVCVDTLSAPPHFGPGGSRLAVALSGAVLGAADILRQRLERVADALLNQPEGSMQLMDGELRPKSGQGMKLTLQQVVGAILTRSDLLPPGVEPSAEATYVWTAPDRGVADEQGRAKSYLTAANACHLVVAEIDRETGKVAILKYVIADDCGTRLNPATVEGMTQGGVAQGIGAALLEEYVYDDSGQILTSTYMDYLIPTVHEVPHTEKVALTTPSPFTPLGTKGMGEGAMNTTPAAIMSAINDALLPLGVQCREVPASPDRLWRLIQRAKTTAASGT
jgi:CO/xanthine dehydrogenase Mo-binding subunit